MATHSKFQLESGWVFKQEDDSSSDPWLPVSRVPTQIHMDLLDNKKIPDPFVDLNERSVQWLPEQAADTGVRTDLVFDGLDTFATVTLNGTKILSTDNMFVSYRTDVTNIISTSEENELEIVFGSALLRGRDLVKEHASEHNFLVRQTEAGRLPIRKCQCNWGWDWGPILMTAGPWKPVYIEQYTVRVDDVWTQHEVSADLAEASGSILVKLDGDIRQGYKTIVTISADGGTVLEAEAHDDGKGLARAPFTIKNPELWYPLTYGKQSLYKVEARLVDEQGKVITSLSKRIGFRRTELVQEPDEHGKSFYFRINNVDIFSGGSCWIPADTYQANISDQRFRDWVKLLADSNQTMLRIWGGGVYEHDALLDACDELGVMIWHDFQFACGNYPVYDSYLNNFELEARQQIRRLRTHPSVVIWAGNNEDYQVQEKYKLEYNYEDKNPESWRRSTFPARYIYEHLLPKLVQEEDPYMIYHPSSPWGDGKPLDDPTVGDIHQWNIWHGLMRKYQDAKSMGGRFVSEFGMEAYPHLSTLNRVISDPSQRYPGSMPMDAHNKAINHERRMMTYVVENFRPTSLDIATYAHLTQIVQAETMRYVYKSWRRDWGKAGSRKCGGVLVWQLNDCWPTVSWAVVDYYLVPKPGFYAISRALRPLDVGVVRTVHDWTSTHDFVDEKSDLKTGQVDHTLAARKGTFDVWIASSRTEPVELSVAVSFISVRSGAEVHGRIRQTVTASPNATTTIIDSAPCPASIPHPEDLTRTFDLSQYDPYVIHVRRHRLGLARTLKYLDFPDRGLNVQVSSTGKQLTVQASRPVKGFVFEETEGVKLSDNGFDLMPGGTETVEVSGEIAAKELKYTYIGAPGPSLRIE
uniref:Beta-mannosidase B n=1 Tax=Bionectria ochroleuca TaxID=29856 RepID=A0A8H7TPT4_BIOOC